MNSTTQHDDLTTSIEKTGRISTKQCVLMTHHDEYQSVEMDADHEAFTSLPQDMKDVIDRACKKLDDWDPADRYFELNKDELHGGEPAYVRFDVYGLEEVDFTETDVDKQKLVEAIREWNGRQLTLQLQMLGLNHDIEDGSEDSSPLSVR